MYACVSQVIIREVPTGGNWVWFAAKFLIPVHLEMAEVADEY